MAQKLCKYYDRQLDYFQVAMVDELGLWANFPSEDAVDEVEVGLNGDRHTPYGLLSIFTRLQLLIVILEDFQFGDDNTPPTPADYESTAVQLRLRDSPFLQTCAFRIEYQDRSGNVYGQSHSSN